MKGKLKAVIFDWGGVLIHDPSVELMNYCANKLGIDISILNKEHAKYEKDFQKGKINESVIWEEICNKLKIPVPNLSSIWGEAVEFSFRNNKHIINIAKGLKSNGYKLGFLSNTEIPALDFFKKQKYDFLDVAVFSCIEGYVKPEKEIYEITLNRLRVKTEEAIFIDDRVIHIEGAKKLGINTILFKDAKQLLTELKHFSINLP